MKKNRQRQAFSLLEILLALSIFGVSVVGVMQGIAAQTRAEIMAENITIATILAQNVLEEVRYDATLEVTSEEGEFEDENIGFTWEYEIEETETEGLFKIQVTIGWLDGAKECDYTVTTLLAES